MLNENFGEWSAREADRTADVVAKLAALTGVDPSQIEVVSCVEGSVVMWIRFNLDDTKLEGDCIEKVTTQSNGSLTQALKYQVM